MSSLVVGAGIMAYFAFNFQFYTSRNVHYFNNSIVLQIHNFVMSDARIWRNTSGGSRIGRSDRGIVAILEVVTGVEETGVLDFDIGTSIDVKVQTALGNFLTVCGGVSQIDAIGKQSH